VLDLFYRKNKYVWVSDGILSGEESLSLMKEAEPQLHDSDTLDAEENSGDYRFKDWRTSSGCGIYKKDYNSQQDFFCVLEKIEKVVESITGLPSSHQEHLQVLRYHPDQEYKVHHDWFAEGTDYYERVIKEGGQRLFTVMFYLNTVKKGGETHFPKLNDLKIKPVMGRAILFHNTADGAPLYESMHAGLPPVDDVKWVAVKWVRESNYAE
jgi:prolyl 4-hydroxylase